ncbi:uncharacterized protein PgNI_11578 [Pyricularia grisea]|uniref:Uncharacterized protein n=1 Tax=Pyricularia grisea TaxID=148305 RepID=A0A6P8ANT0_PYRGI|nr:uncharacterized protein PgNI_11578 [Pyricularia grisea]TLD03690.1 hypothetical protein PgNI_11578 [Pyricularia grisea]
MRFETLIVSILASAAVAVPMKGDGANAALQARNVAPRNGAIPAHFARRDAKEDAKKKLEEEMDKARKKLEDAKKHLPKVPHMNITKPGMPPKEQVKKRAATAELFSDPKVAVADGRKMDDKSKRAVSVDDAKKKAEEEKKKAEEEAKKKGEDARKKLPPKMPGGKNNTKPGEKPKKSDPKKTTPKRSVNLQQRDPLSIGDIENDIKKGLEKLKNKFGKHKNGTAPAQPAAAAAANEKRAEGEMETDSKKDCDKKKDGKKHKGPGKGTNTTMPKSKPTTPPKGKRSLPVRLPVMF